MSEFEIARIAGGAGIGAVLGAWVYLRAREADDDMLGMGGAAACIVVGVIGGLVLSLPLAIVLVIVIGQRATRAAAVRVAHLTSGSAGIAAAGRTGAHLAAPVRATGAHPYTTGANPAARPYTTGANPAVNPYATGATPAVNPYAPAGAPAPNPYAAAAHATPQAHGASAPADPFGPSTRPPAPASAPQAGTPRSAYSGDNINGADDAPLELDTDVPMPSRTGSRSGFVTASGNHIAAQGRRTRSTPAIAQPAPVPIELGDTGGGWGDDPTSPGPRGGATSLKLDDDPFIETNAPPEPPGASTPPAGVQAGAGTEPADDLAAFWGRPPGE